MATTEFVSRETLITADWANDIDRLNYDICDNPADLAELKATLGIGAGGSDYSTQEIIVTGALDSFTITGRYVNVKNNFGTEAGINSITTSLNVFTLMFDPSGSTTNSITVYDASIGGGSFLNFTGNQSLANFRCMTFVRAANSTDWWIIKSATF